MNEWVSVKDRLPESLEFVLFFFKDKHGREILTGYYDNLNKFWTSTIIGFLTPDCEIAMKCLNFKRKYITHWMPLPTPPEV